MEYTGDQEISRESQKTVDLPLLKLYNFNKKCPVDGGWRCPDNNQRSQLLSRIYLPAKSERRREFQLGFTRKIGKSGPETCVDGEKGAGRGVPQDCGEGVQRLVPSHQPA